MTLDRPHVLELRVHGVSGTPPPAVLGLDPDSVRQVAGNDLTSFWRPVDGARPSGAAPHAGGVVEAYSWGGLTSSARGLLGWVRRALWLTLLPFALVNVALWSRTGLTGSAGPTWRANVTAVLVRWAALLLTALLVVTACSVGIDLLAWQCFRDGVPSCPVLPRWAQFLASDTLDDPGRRLAVGQAVPLLLLAGLLLLTRTTIRRYEAVRPQDEGGGTPGPGPLLSAPDMWQGEHRAASLTCLHLAAGTTVVVLATAVAVLGLPAGPGGASGRGSELAAAAAAVLLLACLAVSGLSVADQVEHAARRPRVPSTAALQVAAGVLLALSVLLLLVHTALLVWWPRAPVREDGDLPGMGALPAVLVLALYTTTVLLVLVLRCRDLVSCALGALTAGLVGGLMTAPWWARSDGRKVALLLALLLAVGTALILRRVPRDAQQAWAGLAPAVLVGTATMVAVLFSTATTLLAADRLDGGSSVDELAVTVPPDSPLVAGEPRVFRAAGPSRLQQGWLERTPQQGWVLHQGLLRTGTLAHVAGEVRGTVGSRRLPAGAVLSLADAPLVLEDSCLSRPGRTPVRVAGEVSVALDDAARLVVPAEPADGVPPRCGDLLSGLPRVAAADTPATLVVPAPWVWFAAVLPGALLLVALSLVVLRLRLLGTGLPRVDAALRLGRAADDLEALVREDYPGSDELRRRAARARRSAVFAHRAEGLVTGMAGPVVLAGAFIVGGTLADQPPWTVVDDPEWSAVVGRSADLGLFASVGLALALVAVGARMRTSAGLRRSVGVLWDLATFWPRAAHPFSPPCYAERAVPELVGRVRWVLGGDGARPGHVVLSGHSQGSTLCVAVLLQLREDELDRVRFVSYGTQLRAWFGRVFPDLLGPDVLGHEPTTPPRFSSAAPDAPCTRVTSVHVGRCSPCAPASTGCRHTLAARLDVGGRDPRWVSLYRRSDPLGFPVHQGDLVDGDGAVDLLVLEMPTEGDPAPLPATHSGYPRSAEYRAVLERWWVAMDAGSAPPPPPDVVDLTGRVPAAR